MDVERIALTIDAPKRPAPRRSSASGSTRRGREPARASNWQWRCAVLRGEEILRQVPITIPANVGVPSGCWSPTAPRRRTIGATCAAPNCAAVPDHPPFNRARRGSRLYVRLSTSDPGAVVSGEPMGGLPPSVLAVLESDRSTGSVTSMRSALRAEWEVPLDLAVSGSRQLTLSLDQP